MTKEEAIKYLRQIYPNGGHCWLDNQRIEALQMAIDALSQPSLPEGLEEAAEKIIRDKYPTLHYSSLLIKREMVELIKAGAEWRDALIPKLPDNLEEAARAYMPKPNGIESNTDFSFMQMVWMFEQGASWMAGQIPHWTKDPDFLYGMVSTTCRKDGVTVLAHNGKTIPLSELEKLPVTDIQIRKKH